MSQNTLQNALLWTAGVAVLAGVTIGTITLRNAFPPVGIAPMSVSPCTVVICEEDPEPMCWCGVAATVTVTATPTVIAVSSDLGEYRTEVAVKVDVTENLVYDANFYDFERVEWHLKSFSELKPDDGELEKARFYYETQTDEHGVETEVKKEIWIPNGDSSLAVSMYGTSAQKATVKAEVDVRFVLKKKKCDCDDCDELNSNSPEKYEDKGVDPQCSCFGCGCDNFNYVNATVWVVGVDSIQYQHPTDGWKSVPEPLSIPKGATVNFRAIKSPQILNTDGSLKEEPPSWPAGFPIWTGATPTSNPAIATATFSDVSGTRTKKDENGNDVKDANGDDVKEIVPEIITARCGASTVAASTATANVVVVGVERVEYGANLLPSNPLYVRKDTEVIFKAIPAPDGALWPDKAYGYPSWSGATRDQNDFAIAKRKFETVSQSAKVPEEIKADCGTDWEKVYVVVFDLALTAEKMVNVETDPNKKPIYVAPIMLNDVPVGTYPAPSSSYCIANCVNPGACDHRELEPIFGLNSADSGAGGALVNFTLSISPSDMPGKVGLDGGGAAVRLWKTKAKGKTNGQPNTITLPKEYAISPPDTGPVAGTDYLSLLSPTFAVEGIRTGGTSFTATYDPQSSSAKIVGAKTETLDAAVVALVEDQGGRKVINSKGNISFDVRGAHSGFNGKFVWTDSTTGNPFTGTNSSNSNINVNYSSNATNPANNNIQVPENSANRRFTSTVSVTLDGKLSLTRTVRVAQTNYQGTTVKPPAPIKDRRDEVQSLATPPALDALPPPGWFWWVTGPAEYSAPWFDLDTNYGTEMRARGNGVMQYGSVASTAYGLAVLDPALGDDRRVYGVLIMQGAYNGLFRQEDLASIAEHECQHARQDTAVKTGGNNWRVLDDHYKDAMAYGAFAEADAECVELELNNGGSWKYLQNISYFRSKWEDAMMELYRLGGKNPDGTVNISITAAPPHVQRVAKQIMQDIYRRVPFEQMKYRVPGLEYDWIIRAPE